MSIHRRSAKRSSPKRTKRASTKRSSPKRTKRASTKRSSPKRTKRGGANFKDLPPEMVINVVENLQFSEIIKFCSTNKDNRSICYEPKNLRYIFRMFARKIDKISDDELIYLYNFIVKNVKDQEILDLYNKQKQIDRVLLKLLTSMDIIKYLKFVKKLNNVFGANKVRIGVIRALQTSEGQVMEIQDFIPDFINAAGTDYNYINVLLNFFIRSEDIYFSSFEDTEFEFLDKINNVNVRDAIRTLLKAMGYYNE
jgi:hypothetical protein